MTQPKPTDPGLAIFYDLARRTRKGVLDWLETLPYEDFVQQHGDFAHGSLRAIFEHIADTHLWWTGSVGFGQTEADAHVEDVKGLREVRDRVDTVGQRALESFTNLDEPLGWNEALGEESLLTQRWLILHSVTHEFHHKGQALTLARALGYPHPGKARHRPG